MKIIYNLEDFAISQLFNPYSPYKEAGLEVGAVGREELKAKYHKEIRKDLMWIVNELENNAEWKERVFKRLSNIFNGNLMRFYKHLKHPLIDYCMANIKPKEA